MKISTLLNGVTESVLGVVLVLSWVASAAFSFHFPTDLQTLTLVITGHVVGTTSAKNAVTTPAAKTSPTLPAASGVA